MNFAFPFRINERGRTDDAGDARHLRDLIEQVLFTSPGERVNRPAFGSGLMQLVFAPNSATLAGALQMTVQASLQQWLGDLIEVEDLDVEVEDSTLRLEVRYRTRGDSRSRTAQFSRGL
jgi:phage baseplate assembly protein W